MSAPAINRWNDRYEQGSVPQVLNDARALRRAAKDHPIPDSAVPFMAQGSFPTPNFAVQIVLATYQCPVGWEGLLELSMNDITGDGGTFVQGSGDLIWTIDIDTPLGNPLASTHFLPGYGSILWTMGGLREGPWPIPRGYRMRSGETYRLKVTNVQNVAVGSPSFCHGSMQGLSWTSC